jgi:hypothetical protein
VRSSTSLKAGVVILKDLSLPHAIDHISCFGSRMEFLCVPFRLVHALKSLYPNQPLVRLQFKYIKEWIHGAHLCKISDYLRTEYVLCLRENAAKRGCYATPQNRGNQVVHVLAVGMSCSHGVSSLRSNARACGAPWHPETVPVASGASTLRFSAMLDRDLNVPLFFVLRK